MQKLLTALCLAFAVTSLSHTLAGCAADATRTSSAQSTKDCAAQADGRKLTGAERDNFLNECAQSQTSGTPDKPRSTYSY